MSKQYKLLKDLPDAKAGTILTLDEQRSVYLYKIEGGVARTVGQIEAKFVEGSKEWFKYVPEVVKIDVSFDCLYEFTNVGGLMPTMRLPGAELHRLLDEMYSGTQWVRNVLSTTTLHNRK